MREKSWLKEIARIIDSKESKIKLLVWGILTLLAPEVAEA